jgi:hypothetical protein
MEKAKPGRGLGKNKINHVMLVDMLRNGKTRKECAEHFGVTLGSIKHAEYTIRKKAGTVQISDSVSSVGSGIDAMTQLTDINSIIIKELDRCNKLITREEAKVSIGDTLAAELEKDPTNKDLRAQVDSLMKDNFKGILSAQNNVINMSGEIRKQIELQLKIAETLYSIQMVQEFQSEMIELLKEVDPFIAQKFKAKLVERRQLRGLVKMT